MLKKNLQLSICVTFYWTQGTKRLNLLALTQKYHKGLSEAVVLVLTGYI